MSRSGHGRNGAPTIYDIAAVAGVNPSTVSRALSRPERVAEATVARVKQAAQSLNYQANPIARALHTGRLQTIGLIVADLLNPVYFEVVRGAQAAAAAGNYTLVLAQSVEDPEAEMLAAQRLAGTVDGQILVTSRLDDSQIRELAEVKPVVVINREVQGVTSLAPEVGPVIGEALEHLWATGQRRIAYLPGPRRSWANRQRSRALAEAAETRGMRLTMLDTQPPTREGGAEALEQVLASGVSTVFAYNDLMAIGLLQACARASIHIPEQLGIIGFDDIFGADFTTPALSTVRLPLFDCGARALSSLIHHIEQGEPAESSHIPGSQLVLRGSLASV